MHLLTYCLLTYFGIWWQCRHTLTLTYATVFGLQELYTSATMQITSGMSMMSPINNSATTNDHRLLACWRLASRLMMFLTKCTQVLTTHQSPGSIW